MKDRRFDEPILVRLDGAGTRAIGSAWEALEFLGDWGGARDGLYRSALRACRDALDGLVSPAQASRALRAVVDASGEASAAARP